MSTKKLGRVPYLSEETRRRLKIFEIHDNRFRAAARARQALFREENNLPIGHWAQGTDNAREIGSLLAEDHGNRNLLNSEIGELVKETLAWREDQALLNEDRLYRNMISSMPATFNMCGTMALRPRLASAVLRRLCPGFIQSVDDTLFEHSPKRRSDVNDQSARWTNDRTAWDCLFKIKTPNNQPGFVGCEFKYVEDPFHEATARDRPRYSELSRQSCLFVNPDHRDLRSAPLHQLWRLHLLAFVMVQNGLYQTGRFLLVAPSLNNAVHEAAAMYRSHLLPGGAIEFDVVSYEQWIDAMRRSGATKEAGELSHRYCNWEPVDRLVMGERQ